MILYTSDNATWGTIRSYYKGKVVKGGKIKTTAAGINVPLVAYMPGTVAPGTVDTSLVDMTDFFPTFARIANINKAPYEPLDGLLYLSLSKF